MKKKIKWIKLKYTCIKGFHHSIISLITLLKWVAIGVSMGVIVGLCGTLFSHSLTFVYDLRDKYSWLAYFLPVAGLIIVFLYRFFKNDQDTGTNMVISSIHSSTDIPFKMAPLIFISTVLTHLCGGSAGREGAAIQLGGSIANKAGKILKLNDNSQHIIIMCGMSAGFSALFGTPMAAAIFSLEVISVGIMHYSALVPCIVASFTANFVALFFHVQPESFTLSMIPQLTPTIFFKFILFGAILGGLSILFCVILHFTEHTYKKLFKNPYVRIFAGGAIVVLLALALRTNDYLGSGMSIITGIFETGTVFSGAFILKIVFTALTLGAGYKGGEIVPSFCIGAAFGCAVAGLFGLPPTLVAACGMVGLFCGVTNCPMTSLLIAFELFGFEAMPYFLATIAVSYMLSGYYGLYLSQKIMYSKLETHYVNKKVH